MEKNLIKIMQYLYNKEKNWVMIDKKVIDELTLEDKEIQSILQTPSRNKNYIEGWSPTNAWYLTMKLLPKGIYFIEEMDKPFYKKVISHIQELNGFYTVLLAFLALIISIISIVISIVTN